MRFHVNSINLKRPKTNVTHLSETWTCSCHGVPAWIYFVCRGRGGQWTFVFKLKHVQIRQTMSYSKLMIHKNIEMADSLMIERLEGLPWHCLQAVIDNFNSSVLVCTFSNHQTNTIITSHCLSIISALLWLYFPSAYHLVTWLYSNVNVNDPHHNHWSSMSINVIDWHLVGTSPTCDWDTTSHAGRWLLTKC